MNNLLLGAVAIAMTQVAIAVPTPVDLSSWTVNEVPGGGAANWTVQNAPTNNEVFQSQNSRPSIFFEAGSNAQGLELTGTIQVQTSGDDDFIGFVLGYDSGEAGSASTDFILIDWKQNNQAVGALAGLAISRVTAATVEQDFWAHVNGVTEIARATTLGSTGWNDFQTYSFALTFLPQLIEVSVDSLLELSITAADAGVASFDEGSFGFYNYSQSSVLYSGVFEDIDVDFCEANPTHPNCVEGETPVPMPLALIGLGLLGFRLARKR